MKEEKGKLGWVEVKGGHLNQIINLKIPNRFKTKIAIHIRPT